MAEDESMDWGLRQRMRYVPTKQNPNPQKENPNLWNNDNAKHETLLPDCLRSDHRSTTSGRKRRNTNHSGPWVFQSSNIHPLHDNNHRTRNRTTLPTKRLPLVQSPIKGHLRQRPQVHLALWKSPHNETGNQPQYLNSIPSPDRRPFRKEKSMDRTIPPHGHVCKPRRLDTMATPGLGRAQ